MYSIDLFRAWVIPLLLKCGRNSYSGIVWRENMLGYLSAEIICSEKRTVFRERGSRKTVSFEEQIMSKDKYPSIFLKSNEGCCVYYPSNIFSQHAAIASLSYVNHVKVCQLVSKIPTSFSSFCTDFAIVERICLGKKYNIERKREFFNCAKNKSL